MANKIISYLQLTWLCLKLGFSLFLFGLDVLRLKFDQKKLWLGISLALFSLIWASNFYILHKKNTPQVEVIRLQILENEAKNPLLKEKVLITTTQAADKLKGYKKIEQIGVRNLGLWLNLSQLNLILGNEKLAQDYLNKAKTIAPTLNI